MLQVSRITMCEKFNFWFLLSGSSQLPFAVGIHKARSLGLFFGPKIPKFLSWFWNDLPDNPKQQQLLLWAQNLLQLPCPWPRPSKHLWQGNVLWPVGELDLFLSVCFCFWHFPTIENLGRPSYFLAMHNSAGRWIFIPPTNNCPTSKFTPFIAKWQNPKKTKKRRIFLKWKTVLKGYNLCSTLKSSRRVETKSQSRYFQVGKLLPRSTAIISLLLLWKHSSPFFHSRARCNCYWMWISS